MIARHEASVGTGDLWERLAAPLPAGSVAWRQDGRPAMRDGRFFARFVAYIDANTVRERLDGVVPGEWDLTLELLPRVASDEPDDAACAFKSRLQILGVIREDVGTGRDYKQAATDAFKRAAVRFGIAHELYAYEQNWVRVDGEGQFATPLEDPAEVYARRAARAVIGRQDAQAREGDSDDAVAGAVIERPGLDARPPFEPRATLESGASDEPACPKCGGGMWDNRISKRNPKAPDFKCRNRSCDGVVWPATPAASELKDLPF